MLVYFWAFTVWKDGTTDFQECYPWIFGCVNICMKKKTEVSTYAKMVEDFMKKQVQFFEHFHYERVTIALEGLGFVFVVSSAD